MHPMIQRWNGLAPADPASHAAESRTTRWGIPGYHYVISSSSNGSSNCPGPSATSNSRQCGSKSTWSESPMTSPGVSRDVTGSSNSGGRSLHGSVTFSIVHNIDAAGLYNEAKGEIKLTFSSTLGATPVSGVETRSSQNTTNNASVLTTSQTDDLGDPDDVVAEFLSQINHAAATTDDLQSAGQPSRTLNGVGDKVQYRYVNDGRQPAPFIYEQDSKLNSYGVDGQLLPVRPGADTGSGPAAETLKKMAALHRRFEEKTGNSAEKPLMSSSGYEHGCGPQRQSTLYAAAYQLPVSYCTGSSRYDIMHTGGASKPLSHFPAAARAPVSTSLTMPYPHYAGHHSTKPEVVVADCASFYVSQSQCVDLRLCHPAVQAQATMSQSAAVHTASPYRTQTPSSAWARGPYPIPPYHSVDNRSDWISPAPCDRVMTGNGSETKTGMFESYQCNQEQSMAACTSVDGQLRPPPAYSDHVRQTHDRRWNQATTDSRWRRRPWTRHQDLNGSVQPAWINAELPLADTQPLSHGAYTSSNDSDWSFIDDILNGP